MTMNTETTEQHSQANAEHEAGYTRDVIRQITLKALSSMETVIDEAKGSQGADAVTLRDLAKHARRTRIAFGRLANVSLGQMNHMIVSLAKVQINTGKHTLRTGGAVFAAMGSGVAAGITERLQPRTANKSGQSKPGSGD